MLSADNTRLDTRPRHDDLVLPFRTVKSDVVGRVVRLGPLVHAILSRHAYPEPVSYALGEALALTAMLGSALKSTAKLILQTKTDGPLDFLVADFEQPGRVRGYANFDKADAELAGTKGRGDQGALLGTGHLAMTIDPGGGRDRYQGIVAIGREPLLTAAHEYFRQSEQLPTFIRLAVARHYGPVGDGEPARLALARRRPDDPAAAARGRPAQQPRRRGARSQSRRRGRRELEPRAPPRRDGGGPRADRPDAGARAAALPAVPRGGRARGAGDGRSPRPAAARASASSCTCAASIAEELAELREPDGGHHRHLRVLLPQVPLRARSE